MDPLVYLRQDTNWTFLLWNDVAYCTKYMAITIYNSGAVFTTLHFLECCGLYYKPMMIINDDYRVVNKLEASLTDDARVVIYDYQMFIVQATVRLWRVLIKWVSKHCILGLIKFYSSHLIKSVYSWLVKNMKSKNFCKPGPKLRNIFYL